MIEEKVPAILREKDILVPIKIDMTYGGVRVVDSFCWSLKNSFMTPMEYATQMCSDLDLPFGFIHFISQQIIEQISAYEELIQLVRYQAQNLPFLPARFYEPLIISVGIRLGVHDYSDKLNWNLMSAAVTPEYFSKVTCQDLGLPTEMQSAIAHKIRETLFRKMIDYLENVKAEEEAETMGESGVPEIKVTSIPPNQSLDMSLKLWKRAKPNAVEEVAAVPQPLLPNSKDTNADVWISDVK